MLFFGCFGILVSGLTPTQQSDALAAFNAERSIFYLQPFIYNTSFESIPQGWADTCPTGHNPNRGFLGENIFWSSSSTATVVDAINAWNAEQVYYNCPENICCDGTSCEWFYCGHWTQDVWNTTTQVACGINNNCPGTYATVVVCDFSPPGNFDCNGASCERPFPASLCYLMNNTAPPYTSTSTISSGAASGSSLVFTIPTVLGSITSLLAFVACFCY
jgi:hypothetical protein